MTESSKEMGSKGEILKMTADVVAAYVGNTRLIDNCVLETE